MKKTTPRVPHPHENTTFEHSLRNMRRGGIAQHEGKQYKFEIKFMYERELIEEDTWGPWKRFPTMPTPWLAEEWVVIKAGK